MRAFVTGTAGFIGFHLARRLLREGHEVLGYDGLTPYYDVDLKRARLQILDGFDAYSTVEAMLEDKDALDQAVGGYDPDVIIHLAAQAGVRYSLENPAAYISSNLVGTYNLLEVAEASSPRHLLFASTSSVYGGNEQMPFGEPDRTDFPVSLYAATKKSGEAMSHAYSHLFKIPTTCFRFFTVYGPWGRPDMALFKFVERMLSGEPIEVYGQGKMRRDFTYIDDLVQGIMLLIDCPPEEGRPVGVDGVIDSLSPVAPWRVVNIAGGQPLGLVDFIETIEKHLGMTAEKIFKPMQKGDVQATFANAGLLKSLTGFEPASSIDHGVKAFVDWYRDYRDVVQN
ncbi:NAD-dependent epimerase/dehydratase family protein [Mycolicibacterium austroafricanum]|uniref:NAD-dependent epimerase/dehydratase family protein n=1 Tax=Mycolicibacterium austroafricanum TaxID=39687 RepID=UPI000CFA69DB|nr:NAD-dependent epimerase/dehydratase family protein [Mycolicibacterium austroafricanum]PQP41640.1 UDP-glucuronate 5-epimerase [Mycolicibacterium austroafricanum]